jgi:hypothetical protein
MLHEVREELGLPVDTPKALYGGTIKRFTKWHLKNLPKQNLQNSAK